MPESIDSPLFGPCGKAPADKRAKIDQLTSDFPVDAFQALNALLNKRGYMIAIALLNEPREDH